MKKDAGMGVLFKGKLSKRIKYAWRIIRGKPVGYRLEIWNPSNVGYLNCHVHFPSYESIPAFILDGPNQMLTPDTIEGIYGPPSD